MKKGLLWVLLACAVMAGLGLNSIAAQQGIVDASGYDLSVRFMLSEGAGDCTRIADLLLPDPDPGYDEGVSAPGIGYEVS